MANDPGRRNDRILIQLRNDPAGGGAALTYRTVATVSATFRQLGGREFREGNIAVGEQRATFTTNYREGLRQVDRIIHLGRGGRVIWNIRSVTPLGFKAGLDINCTTTGSKLP